MKEGQQTLVMLLSVTYDTEGVGVDELKDNMEKVVEWGMGDGHYTGDTDATIDEWNAEVFTSPGNYDGSQCPNCGSANINGDEIDPEGFNVAFRKVHCDDCGASWTEDFRVVGYYNLEVEPLPEPSPSPAMCCFLRAEWFNTLDSHESPTLGVAKNSLNQMPDDVLREIVGDEDVDLAKFHEELDNLIRTYGADNIFEDWPGLVD